MANMSDHDKNIQDALADPPSNWKILEIVRKPSQNRYVVLLGFFILIMITIIIIKPNFVTTKNNQDGDKISYVKSVVTALLATLVVGFLAYTFTS